MATIATGDGAVTVSGDGKCAGDCGSEGAVGDALGDAMGGE